MTPITEIKIFKLYIIKSILILVTLIDVNKYNAGLKKKRNLNKK